MIQRCLLHLRMEIDHRQRAILHRIAGAKFHPILEGTGKHRAIEGAMSHSLFAAFAQLVRIHIGFFMGRKVNRLLPRQTVFGR